jgi:hypothetical protein
MVRSVRHRRRNIRRTLPCTFTPYHQQPHIIHNHNSQWFGTYNFLEGHLPLAHSTLQKLGRRAFIGFVASVVSDTTSNSLRVVKTYRQVNETRIGYTAAARAVIAVDGLKGLFGRGLKTRILANGLQGLMFSVLWRFFMDL